MSQDQTSISCPNCGEDIDVNDILYHQVDEQLKKKYQDELKREKKKFETQSDELEQQRKAAKCYQNSFHLLETSKMPTSRS